MQNTYDSDKRKLLSSLCHGSIFLSALLISVGIPLAILIVSDDSVVKDNAKEALNFHVNLWLYGGIAAICAALWWTIILLPFALLGGLVVLASWVMPVLAILSCLSKPEQVYRYPFIFRVL
jgi:uncharacterized Tic20 family protein